MQGDRRNGDMFPFGDPFGSFGGPGMGRSLMSRFFERDLSNDPFFSSSGSIFGFGSDPFRDRGGFIEQRENQAPQSSRKNVVIEELPDEPKDAFRMHNSSSQEPIVEDPDDEDDEDHRIQGQAKSQNQSMYESSHLFPGHSQSKSFSFQSSSVTYGGINGAYYTSSTTRRTGPDGVIEEEHMEADTTTGKATKRISRGIRDKGHSLTKKLNSDGRVDTMEALHNLNEDEVAQFNEDWERRAQKSLSGGTRTNGDRPYFGVDGTRSTRQNAIRPALPSTEQSVRKDGKQSDKDQSSRKWFGLRKARDFLNIG